MIMDTFKFASGRSCLKKWKGLWENALNSQQKNQLKMMLDSGQFILYFAFDKEVFGAGEGSRVTFAKMKDPSDPDHTTAWIKEANFTALNLTQLGQGKQVQVMFSEEDLKKIDVLTKEEAYNRLEEFFASENK